VDQQACHLTAHVSVRSLLVNAEVVPAAKQRVIMWVAHVTLHELVTG
jgi:hypothetical protein